MGSFCDFFDIEIDEFNSIYQNLLNDPNSLYREFFIIKKNGNKRIIHSPTNNLKIYQKKLSDNLIKIYKNNDTVHSFCKKRGILTNSVQHLKKNIIFNIDLVDFFHSIKKESVFESLKKEPFCFTDFLSVIISNLVTYNGFLPQGAPTSPIISNIVCGALDDELSSLALKNNCIYTRYCDDISFSFEEKELPESLDIIDKKNHKLCGELITSIVEKFGFKINYSKVRICKRPKRLEVTGITVNEFPNVRRKYVQNVKSIIYACEKWGVENAEKTFYKNCNFSENNKYKPSFLKVLRGKILFLKQIRGEFDFIFNNLALRFNNLLKSDIRKIKINYIGLITREKYASVSFM